MIDLIFVSLIATNIPQQNEYWCKLQKIEAKICIYWCGNRYRAFNWFEVKKENGCRIQKKFYEA